MSVHIIKAKIASGDVHVGPIKRDVQDAKLQAQQIVNEAQAEAQKIIETADCERQTILETSREKGYADGLGQWNEILANAWKRSDDFLAQREPALVQLAIRIANKIINAELQTSKETIIGIVRAAVQSAQREKTLVLQINPAHEVQVRTWAESLSSSSRHAPDIRLMVSSEIPEGGCIVESDIGIVDARLETQLQRLEEALLERAR
jgi:type III secretion protein L